jgi:hypothetical protein
MTKYELAEKIKDKWFLRGFVAAGIGAFLSGLLSDNSQVVSPISTVIIAALCFVTYKSELASALLRHRELKKGKRKK